MNTGELARATATRAETIRYYERIGLLPPPPRTTGNDRDYSAEHISRLAFTRRARALGFSIQRVRPLLEPGDRKEQSCETVDAIAREHLAKVEHKIASLTAPRRELASIIGQCSRRTIAECRILDALAPEAPRQQPRD
jgi:DNA-binding transcriptional MerR regulator